jgi:tripartite-type tricarboxylate transporter receptor subunit TctC
MSHTLNTPDSLKMLNTRRLFIATAAALALAGTSSAWSQAWPTKPVKIVVPFAPGGSTDVVARMLGQKLGETWGQSVIIENRSGAGGNTGTDMVVKSAADGYTLVMASGSITINPNIYARMPFDTKRDLVPITNVASGPMLVVVQDRSEYKTIRDLVNAAKAKPGSLNFGSAGVGSQVHMAAENLSYAAGIEMEHVPYKGESPAYTDLIGGQVQTMVGNIAAAAALVGPGRLRALAVTGTARSPLLPDVPTVAESGLPGFENTGWFGLLAPAGTPADVVNKIYKDTAKALADTQIKGRLYVLGMQPVGSTPAELTRQMDAELLRWAEVVKARKLKAN